MRNYEVELMPHGVDVATITVTVEAESIAAAAAKFTLPLPIDPGRVVGIREVGISSAQGLSRMLDVVLRKLQAISKAVNASDVLIDCGAVVVDSPVAAEHASPLDPVAQIESQRDEYRRRCEQLEKRVLAVEAERAIEQRELAELHARFDAINRLASGEGFEATIQFPTRA